MVFKETEKKDKRKIYNILSISIILILDKAFIYSEIHVLSKDLR